MPKSEAQAVKQARDFFRNNGIFTIKIAAGEYQAAGLPDVIACINGKFVAIEFKRILTISRKPKVTPLQKYYLDAIKAAGGISCVLSWIDDTGTWRLDVSENPHTTVTVLRNVGLPEIRTWLEIMTK